MSESEAAWQDALLAIRVAEVARHRIGGIHLRARAGPVRDIWLDHFHATLTDAPIIRFSPEVDEGRLLGDLDLARTLAEGRPVLSEGLLTRADGGAVVLAMAERAEPTLCGILAGAMDTGTIRAARMAGESHPARFTLIAMDEGAEPDERLPVALDDRMGLRVDLSAVSWRIATGDLTVPAPASLDFADITMSDPMLTALTTAAMQAGWQSMRGALWLSVVARIVAALNGAQEVAPEHAASAIRLVFGPVTVAEETEEPAQEQPDDQPPPPPPPPPDEAESDSDDPLDLDPETLQDMLIAAEAMRTMQLPILLPADVAGAQGRGSGKAGALKALEPTRSLVRAKRALGRLPGGGPTPLADGMAKALELSTRILREGSTPLLVMMTDGNGNIALDGTANRAQSREDVAALSRHLACQPMRRVMIDISARPRDTARTFAAGLHADYVALPRADASSVSRLVSTYMQDR